MLARAAGAAAMAEERIEVGDAVAADVPGLLALQAALFAQEAEFHPDPERQRRALALIMGDPRVGRVFAARSAEGRVVAMAIALHTVSTFLGGRVCLLEDVVVDPAHRSRGIGTLLLRAVVERLRAEGCGRITLLTDADNAAAQRLYRRHGFVRSGMAAFRLPL